MKKVFTELIKVAEFLFAILSDNANVGRILSLIAAQRTEKRNRLLLPSVKEISMPTYNLKYFHRSEFYNVVLFKKKVLTKISNVKIYIKIIVY